MPETVSAALILSMRLALLLLLYLFIAAVFWLIWRDLRATARQVEQPRRALARLVVEDGGGSQLHAGETFNVLPVTAVGRDLSNTIVLSDAAISGEHCLLSLRDGQWWIEDLGSRNGTYLNGVRVTRPLTVSPGDAISLGRIQFRLVV
ncbi:MAG: FHA domain-containing protein [Anaerolineae bacterium]